MGVFFLCFLATLSMSSLVSKALCIVLIFHVLCFIFLNSCFVYFKNGPEYLIKGTAKMFIPLMRFLQQSSVTSRFFVFLSYFFLLFYLSFLLVWWSLLPIVLSICNFLFFQAFWSFPDLTVLFILLFLFSYFHYNHVTSYINFHSYILAAYSYCLYQSLKFFLVKKKITWCHLCTLDDQCFIVTLWICRSYVFLQWVIEWHYYNNY